MLLVPYNAIVWTNGFIFSLKIHYIYICLCSCYWKVVKNLLREVMELAMISNTSSNPTTTIRAQNWLWLSALPINPTTVSTAQNWLWLTALHINPTTMSTAHNWILRAALLINLTTMIKHLNLPYLAEVPISMAQCKSGYNHQCFLSIQQILCANLVTAAFH